MKNTSIFFVLIGLLAISCQKNRCKNDSPEGDNTLWYALLGSDPNTPNFPDYNVNYFVYNFDRQAFPDHGIRLDGFFGNARYMSYNVYDFSTGQGVATLIDEDIAPNACSNNPFQTTADPDRSDNGYTLYILPETMEAPEGAENVLRFSETIDTVSVFFRYYIPQGSPSAGVELPYISAITTEKPRKIQAAPPQIAQDFEEGIDQLVAKVESFLQVQIDSQLRFYNVNASGMFTNMDASYLATPITVQSDEVYLVRFRAPQYATTAATFASADVRYWSINLGDGQTHRIYTLKDEDALIHADGWVEIVIAEDTPANRDRAAGRNFIPLTVPVGEPMGIIYRNLLPRADFSGNINAVPVLDTTPINVLLLDAHYFIEEYAPRGVRISTQAYLTDFGGFF